MITKEDSDLLFEGARTHKAWLDKPVEPAQLHALYDLLKWGPTSANCCPARFVFIQSAEAKERLKLHLDKGNVEKTMSAPVTAIVAYDLDFYKHMDFLAPHMKTNMFAGKPADETRETATRNGTLQGGYFIMAARAVGLDCGPMSGFNRDGVRQEFFPEKNWEANFLCNLGHGDPAQLFPRAPRFAFDDVCEIL